MITENVHEQEEVRVMDFGIAKLIDDAALQHGALRLTATGEAIGSPLYMSPEQARGEKIDQRTDLYSLGCVMYELLSGNPPFSSATPMEIMLAHMQTTPLSMSQAVLGAKEFDSDLEALVARLLQKNPDARYQSADELAAALRRLEQGQSLDRYVPDHGEISLPTESKYYLSVFAAWSQQLLSVG